MASVVRREIRPETCEPKFPDTGSVPIPVVGGGPWFELSK